MTEIYNIEYLVFEKGLTKVVKSFWEDGTPLYFACWENNKQHVDTPEFNNIKALLKYVSNPLKMDWNNERALNVLHTISKDLCN